MLWTQESEAWGDFEVYDYDDLTRLGFEEGSVATQVVLGTAGGRTERIKAPNQQAGSVRKALQEAVFAYHDVDSLDALNRKLEPETTPETAEGDGLNLDDGIDPLVGRGEGTTPTQDSGESAGGGASTESILEDAADLATEAGADSGANASGTTGEGDLAAVTARLDELEAALERQNELLATQQETLKRLVEELKRGR